MHVLTTRGGELVSIVGRSATTTAAPSALLGRAGIRLPVDVVTFADCDVSTGELEAAATHFLHITGWADVDAELAAELARDMPDQAAEVASWYPPGTRVRAQFDHGTGEWTFTPVSA